MQPFFFIEITATLVVMFTKPKAFRTIFLFFTISLFIPPSLAAQKPTNAVINTVKELHDYSAYFYGIDDLLVNGRKYVPEHGNAKGHPYFPEPDWVTGTLVIKKKTYKDVEFKYNVDLDKIILRAEVTRGGLVYVLLNDGFVTSFIIGEHYFINSSQLLQHDNSGYFELVFEGKHTLLIKYHKSFISEFSQNAPLGRFSDLNSMKYIYCDGMLYRMPNKKSLLTYFKQFRKEIKKYMKQEKINYKKANNFELHHLLKYCNEISSK